MTKKQTDFRNLAVIHCGNDKTYAFRAGPDGRIISEEIEITEEPFRSRGIGHLYDTVVDFVKNLYKTYLGQ